MKRMLRDSWYCWVMPSPPDLLAPLPHKLRRLLLAGKHVDAEGALLDFRAERHSGGVK